MIILFGVIDIAVQAMTWLVVISVVLSYLMDPYHQVRRTIDSIVEPLLRPIRRALPPILGLDWSPLVLILLIQTLGWVLRFLLILIV